MRCLTLTYGGRFGAPVELSEKAIGDKALDAAVSSIGGFPFMMQLVGFRFWQAAGDERTVSLEHVQQGVERAREDMGERVLASDA